MEENEIIERLNIAIKNQKGDWGRNQYLLNRLKNNQDIFNSDRIYLSKILGIPKDSLNQIYPNINQNKKQDIQPKISYPIHKCDFCKTSLKLGEKTIRNNNHWYHAECFDKSPASKHIEPKSTKKSKKSIKKKIRKKPDAVQLLLTGSIFVFLVSTVYFLLGTLSVIAMGIGGILLIYHLFSSYSNALKPQSGRKGPSTFIMILIATPFVIGALVAYEGPHRSCR